MPWEKPNTPQLVPTADPLRCAIPTRTYKRHFNAFEQLQLCEFSRNIPLVGNLLSVFLQPN